MTRSGMKFSTTSADPGCGLGAADGRCSVHMIGQDRRGPEESTSVNPNTANVLRTYWRARPDELHHGHLWYAQAAGEACRRIPDFDRETVLGVVAALSPQTAWARNIRYAELLVYEGRCPSTGSRM